MTMKRWFASETNPGQAAAICSTCFNSHPVMAKPTSARGSG